MQFLDTASRSQSSISPLLTFTCIFQIYLSSPTLGTFPLYVCYLWLFELRDLTIHFTSSILIYSFLSGCSTISPILNQINYNWTCRNYTQATQGSFLPSTHVVFVEVACEPQSWVTEVDWVQSLTTQQDCGLSFLGIVGHAALESSNISNVLDTMRARAPFLRGIREVVICALYCYWSKQLPRVGKGGERQEGRWILHKICVYIFFPAFACINISSHLGLFCTFS